jgi:GNAT superfamily N-acetyltransferase
LSLAITIRLASLEDVPALQQLIVASVRLLSLPYYSAQEIDGGLIHVFGVDRQLIHDETYFVAEIATQIVGCGGWSKRRTLFGGDQAQSVRVDELLDPKTDAARVRAFFVDPNWSRKGIGRQILDACEQAASESGFSRLELASTLPGEPFYSALGYSILEPFDIPLPDNQSLPVIRMEKVIQSGSKLPRR